MVSVAILAAAPIGKLAARVGSVPCVVASTLIITVLVCALTFVRHIASLLVFATIFGLAVCLFSVADLALVVQTLPNDETSGNDMGIWNLFQYLGTAIGASVSGAVLSMYPADEPLAPTHIAADTPPSLPPVTMAVLGAAERAAHCDSSSCTAPLRDRYAIEGCACAAPPNPAVETLRAIALTDLFALHVLHLHTLRRPHHLFCGGWCRAAFVLCDIPRVARAQGGVSV